MKNWVTDHSCAVKRTIFPSGAWWSKIKCNLSNYKSFFKYSHLRSCSWSIFGCFCLEKDASSLNCCSWVNRRNLCTAAAADWSPCTSYSPHVWMNNWGLTWPGDTFMYTLSVFFKQACLLASFLNPTASPSCCWLTPTSADAVIQIKHGLTEAGLGDIIPAHGHHMLPGGGGGGGRSCRRSVPADGRGQLAHGSVHHPSERLHRHVRTWWSCSSVRVVTAVAHAQLAHQHHAGGMLTEDRSYGSFDLIL